MAPLRPGEKPLVKNPSVSPAMQVGLSPHTARAPPLGLATYGGGSTPQNISSPWVPVPLWPKNKPTAPSDQPQLRLPFSGVGSSPSLFR